VSRETFQKTLRLILKWEGDFVDKRDVHGGRKNKGVIQPIYDVWRSTERLPHQPTSAQHRTSVAFRTLLRKAMRKLSGVSLG
jgi:lysozyme family protein